MRNSVQKMNVIASIIIGMSVSGVLASSADAQVRIACDGKAIVSIVVAEDATAVEKFAATELAGHLQQATGAAFNIVQPDAVDVGASVIAVGPGAAAAIDPEIDVSSESLGAEGIILRTSDDDLILTGGIGSVRGTLYAVETFLEDEVGYRWWGPDEVHVPQTPVLTVNDIDVRHVPTFEYREIHAFAMFEPATAMRNKINGASSPIAPEQGGHTIYAGPFFVHTFGMLVPHAELFATHPEWFSEVNGQRVAPPAATQLCLTNAELLEYVKQKVRKIAGEVPAGTTAIISVSQDDHQVQCQCAKCQAVNREEGGTPAGSLLRFVNAIADDIAQDYPNILIDTLAYQYTRKAPKITKPRANVIVRLCSYECSYAQPYTDPINQSFARDVREWSRISDRLYVWDYITNFRYYNQPHPNLHTLGQNAKFFADHNVKGIFSQGNRHSPAGDFATLKNWVIAKLLWDATLDGDALIKQFIDEYYQEAGPDITAYIALLEKSAGRNFIGISDSNHASYLTPAVLEQGYELLQSAHEKAAGNAVVQHRVEQVQASILHAITTSWGMRRQLAEMAGQDWPLSKPLDAYLDEMQRIFESQKIKATSEGDYDVDIPRWIEKLRQTQTAPNASLPAELAKLPRNDWFDLQDVSFDLYGGEAQAKRVDDSTASDGRAAQMAGNHAAWSVQSILHPLPGATKWTIYAVVRIERTGIGGAAFQYGVYDNVELAHVIPSTSVLNADVQGDGYRLYRLGAVDLKSTSFVWIAPTDNPDVQNIVIDRILLVKGDHSVD